MKELVQPMFAMVMLTFFVGVTLFTSRFKAMMTKKVRMSYFKSMDGGSPTESMVKSQRHFANLFEVPVLFYAVCATSIALKLDNENLLCAAWVFVGARVAQALVHLTFNNVRTRVFTYFFGFFTVIYMWCLVLKGI